MQKAQRFGLGTASYQNSEVKIAISKELAELLSLEEMHELLKELMPIERQILAKIEKLADKKGIVRITSPTP